ncbi:tyrosine-type recombinase/integrase [Fulvimarina sp. MAC3]|uniref:tyrosine-type recombinase/integrase n=1 Tax=Fulvimarina sp. MAC3 TaxID=3148887 RepID=UPI0031FCFAE1
MKRPNPFPGVTTLRDRHGKVRHRFRQKGKPSCYLSGAYGSVEFRAAYEKAFNGEIVVKSRSTPGTLAWLIESYLQTKDVAQLKGITRTNTLRAIERLRVEHGHRVIGELRPHHVERLLTKKIETPAAANHFLKLLRRICRYGVRKGVLKTDPTAGIRGFSSSVDGYHTWTDAEIEKFERHHGLGSKPVLALRIMLYTGAARQDAAAMGWQNVRGERIAYRRHKTGGEVDIPIIEELAEALELVDRLQLLFVTWGEGRGYKPETFANWFKDQCAAAGLPHCNTHGLRKAGATRLANAGATEFQIMAFLGHKTPEEARTYVKKANRATLGTDAIEKLRSMSNRVAKLDTKRAKPLNEKGN